MQESNPETPESRSHFSANRRPPWQWLPVLLLVPLTWYLGCFEETDYDFWWHLRTGQLIPERGIPVTDWYCFNAEGNLWIDVHWGFQVTIAWIHGHFGLGGVIAVKALVASLAVGVALLAYRRDGSPLAQVVVWIPALLLMSSRFYSRPETFTLFFTACYLTILFHAERRPWLLWFLPIVQVAWANVQGLFIFGPILLSMFFIEALMRMESNRGLFRHLIPVTALTLAACAVSPYRLANVLFVLELWKKMGSEGKIYKENIAELIDIWDFWAQGGSSSPYVLIQVGLLVLGIASVLVAWRTILTQRRAFRVLPLLAFGWLGLQAVRNGNHFALVAGTVISWNLGGIEWSRLPLGDPRRRRRDALLFAIGLLLVATAAFWVLTGRWYQMVGGHRRFGFGLRPSFYSFPAVELAGKPGMPQRAAIFHIGHAACYIYSNGPERKVFMDGRLEVNSEAMFRDYMAVEDKFKSGNTWDAALQAYGVDLVLADGEYNHSVQAAILAHPGWECLYHDEVLALFLRKSVRRPEGVEPVDFKKGLFEAPIAIFESPQPTPGLKPGWWFYPPATAYRDRIDFYAERLLHLGYGLTSQERIDPSVRSAIFWRAAQEAEQAIRRRPFAAETYRWLGGAFLATGGLDMPGVIPPSADEPWEATTGLLAACGMAAMQRAIQCDPHDYSANFQLQTTWARFGAMDRSVEPLRRLCERRPTNRTQADLIQRIHAMLAERLNQVDSAKKLVDPNDATYAGLQRCAKAGLLGEALARVKTSVAKELNVNDADRVGTWFLLVGDIDPARSWYNELQGRTDSPKGLIEVRLGCCAHALGEYADAREWYLRALRADADNIEAFYGLALLNLLAGDRNQCADDVERALSRRPTSKQRVGLNALRDLVALP